jgi:hypothetical protein
MKDWLIKYWIPPCALFVACLSLYLNLQNWKRQGTNLTALALNIAVTFVMLGILLIAIITFYSRNQKLAEKLRQCELTGPETAMGKQLVEDVGYRQDEVKRVGFGFVLPESLFGLQILEATAP